MQRSRPLIGLLAALAVLVVPASSIAAQGLTTGALSGAITDEAGKPIESAQVQVKNANTGANVGSLSRNSGLYVLQGLEPGTGYVMIVRAIGYAPYSRDGITITLGQTRREDFKMVKQAAQLTEVKVTAAAVDYVINTNKTGLTSTISDSALRRMPTLNRNFADFVASVPQVSTTTGYLSGGGVNLRQNSIQIDGAQSGDLFGLGTTGQAGASANAKSIPLDAVKEYQVLLSPYDVRQGGFGGLLINAVTKSGTNDFHGSAFGYTRNQDLTRTQPYLADYSQQQYGGTFGGRIIRDKLFFFLSGEAQELQTPALGSYIGGTGSVAPYVKQSDIDAVSAALAKYGFTDPGDGNLFQKKNPLRNFFGRLDANLPLNSRAVLRYNYASADNAVFSRGLPTTATPNFGLTSNSYLLSNKTKSTVFELFTNIRGGLYNEFLTNYSTTKDFRTVPVNFPQITVRGIARSDTTGTANFVAGTESSSQGNTLDQRTIEYTDNLTIPVGAHSFTIGGKILQYRSINLFAANSTGNWTFNTLADLNNGVASSYVISAPAPTDPYGGIATIKANSYTAYASDQWQANDNLSLNFGVRYDKPKFDNLPPYNGSVDTVYHRSTNVIAQNGQWSPRFGFNWDVTGDKKNQLRGGVGYFSGPPPFVYLSNAFGNSGLSGYSSLTCNGTAPSNTATTSLLIPAFTADAAAHPPLQCLSGTRPNGTTAPGAAISGPAASAAVNTIDPNFKNPKYLKASLGADHRFADGIVATVEGLYTRSKNNAFYQNLSLVGFQGFGLNSRPLYGTFTAAGATPTTIGSRLTVLDVTNSSGDYTWSTTGQLQKAFTSSFEASASYTYQQARDVASVTSSTAGSNYRYQRDQGDGFLNDRKLSRSKYDQPHKISFAGSYHFKTFTDLSVVYSGTSGAPFDFVYGSNGGTTGDLNADGQTQNDLMYIPKNANNQDEILFRNFNSANADSVAAAAGQAAAFDKFISANDCLNSQRGKIMERNSCRNPWVNRVDISLAQSLGKIGGHLFQNVQLRLDIINFTNLLNKNWGESAFSDQNSTCGQICSATVAPTHTGNILPPGSGTTSQAARPIFTFSPSYKIYNSDNASSNYRMQLSARYSF